MVKSEERSLHNRSLQHSELGVLALKSGSKGQEGEGEAVEMGPEIIFWTTETAQH